MSFQLHPSGNCSEEVYDWYFNGILIPGTFGKWTINLVPQPGTYTVRFSLDIAPNVSYSIVLSYGDTGNTGPLIWYQKGIDINGEATSDLSGSAVSMPDRNTVVIGAPYNNNGSITDAGHARVYSWNGSAWVQKGQDINGQWANEHAGSAVCMPDANTLAIGSPVYNGSMHNEGRVRVYVWDGVGWYQKGSDIKGEKNYDKAGSSVSMPDANTVAIGAYMNDGSGTDAGHVRVYKWSGSAWVQKGTDLDGAASQDMFGWSVSMPDSNTVAMGAPIHSGNGAQSGQVRVYSWDGFAWMQKGTDIDGEATNDLSGWSVSMADANNIAIGARSNDGNGSNAGQVRIYSWNGSAWIQKGSDIDGEAAGDGSGYSLCMPDVNTVAVGAPDNYGNGSEAGHVRIYSWDGNSWVKKGIDLNGENSHVLEGYAVSMPDAHTVAIGARQGGSSYAGQVRVYSCSSYGQFSDIICNSYVSPGGNDTWTSAGTYTDAIPNSCGCDSTLTVKLTRLINTEVVNQLPALTAVAEGALYQWVDCSNNYAIIDGATSQSFITTISGNYAVIITQYDCTDTSDCMTLNHTGFWEKNFGNSFSVYPNPSNGKFKIDFGGVFCTGDGVIYNTLGQQTGSFKFESQNNVDVSISGEAGVYLVEVRNANQKKVMLQVVKK